MEALGLVLGVIPVAIQALNTYQTVLASIKNVKRDLAFMIRDLKTEQQILQNTCENLLKGIVPDSALDRMIEEPFGPDWKVYDNEVRLRLWRSSTVFQERLEEMRQAALELQRKLAIDGSGKTRLVDRSSILAELKHGAYFTLKKKDYASILCRLKDGNAVLNTLANQNSELEPTRRSRSQAKLARLIRKVSQGIYSAFQNVMACKCSHNLGLEMAPRNDVMLPGDEDDEAARSLDFSLIIGSSSYGQEHSNSTQRWERVRVQMAGNEIELPTPPTTPSPGIQRSKSPRRVRWTSSLTMMRTVQTTTSVTQTTTHLHNASSLSASIHLSSGPQPSAITNLCHMLKTGKGKATVPDCYGHISNKSSKFNLYPELEDCQPENLSTISLRAILEGQAGDDGLGQFTYTERLKVALALSYSILHLYNTPWLARIVTSDDIVFLREQQAPSCHIYYLDRPFLSKSLSASGNPTSGYQQHPTQTMFRPVDLTILSLGLLLTQIIIGRHVKDLAAVPDMGMDSIIEKQKIASNMAGSVLQNGGMNYAGAVQWCLSSILSVACLDDEKFGQEFHGAVIARLENDLRLQSSMTSTT